MFKEWDFLLAEIWVLLALAALIGLLAGWLIWGGRVAMGADADEVRRLQAELERAKAKNRASMSDPLDDIPAMEGGGYVRPTPPPKPAPAKAVEPEPEPVVQAATNETEAAQADPDLAQQSAKPQGLDAARDGLPDDLTKIKGIGAKMEKLCNRLGFWHYDQIASWSADEIAWVDENLEGFKGRVTRDEWVAQAKALTGNATPAFVRRKD
mgnify:CR=1 FL=1